MAVRCPESCVPIGTKAEDRDTRKHPRQLVGEVLLCTRARLFCPAPCLSFTVASQKWMERTAMRAQPFPDSVVAVVASPCTVANGYKRPSLHSASLTIASRPSSRRTITGRSSWMQSARAARFSSWMNLPQPNAAGGSRRDGAGGVGFGGGVAAACFRPRAERVAPPDSASDG
jgi:hypothetical protein